MILDRPITLEKVKAFCDELAKKRNFDERVILREETLDRLNLNKKEIDEIIEIIDPILLKDRHSFEGRNGSEEYPFIHPFLQGLLNRKAFGPNKD